MGKRKMRHLLKLLVLIIAWPAIAESFFLEYDYAEERAKFETYLLREAPSPQKSQINKNSLSQYGAERIFYRSEGRQLFGWLYMSGAPDAPTVVLIHGGWAMHEMATYEEGFMARGFNVFVPTFRGENGNPGNFELMLGEAQDAIASIRHISNDRRIRRDRIFVFGWSIGGGISALIALHDENLPIGFTASAGGLYPPGAFGLWWRDIVPFDYGDPLEIEMRLMMFHADELVHDHIGYFGTEEINYIVFLETYGSPPYKNAPRLQIVTVPGDHSDGFINSLDDFTNRVKTYLSGEGR